MTGNHRVLLLCRSLCLGRRSRRLQQSSLIGNSVYIRLYRLSFLVGRICVCPIPAHNEGVASKRSCEFYHISVLLDPVVDIHQRRSVLRLCTLHEGRDVYPAMIRLYLQLEVRPVWTRYCAGFVPTLWVCVKHIFSRKENPTANWPCLNKALLSSFFELCNLCKCLCHKN